MSSKKGTRNRKAPRVSLLSFIKTLEPDQEMSVTFNEYFFGNPPKTFLKANGLCVWLEEAQKALVEELCRQTTMHTPGYTVKIVFTVIAANSVSWIRLAQSLENSIDSFEALKPVDVFA